MRVTPTSAATFCLTTFLLVCILESQEPWKRHTIDNSLRGADGVRLADFDGDGLMDVVTGWEESGIVRLYLNPGYEKTKQRWPAVTVGKAKSPEDAVPFDVDGDGELEVISCHEGKVKRVFVHKFSPSNQSVPGKADRLEASNWQSQPVKQLDGQQWMFATPIEFRDGRSALAIGSKNQNASVTLLAPKKGSTKDIAQWQPVRLRDAGWIMSIQVMDMDQDGDQDIVFSDRKSKNRAVSWLQQPDTDPLKNKWKEIPIGATDVEPMFIDARPNRVLVPSRNKIWIDFRKIEKQKWEQQVFENPPNVPFGKAIRLLGNDSVVLTANTRADKEKRDQPGIWIKESGKDWRPIGTMNETKFDRMELIDLDGDGDLDVMTCEERRNLGVVWYENPGIR